MLSSEKVTIHDFSTKSGTIAAIRSECNNRGLTMPEQQAYVLATVEHETNGTFKPIKEAYWLSEDWRKRNLSYYPYYGRGYVQITWKCNYEEYSHKLGEDLVADPDLVLREDISLYILVDGFLIGGFTGKKLTDYINENKVDYYDARRCINGTDKAKHVAELAKGYAAIGGNT